MATSNSWAQDVILCDLCDKAAQQFCNSCQISLCETCVIKHREDVQSLLHDIVPFLERKIQLVRLECQHHPGQRCEAKCLQCSEPVCFKCIISGPHREHEVEELTQTHENIKLKIEKDMEEIQGKIIPKYQKKNVEIENSMSRTKKQFDEIKTECKKLRKLWHQEVDNIFDKIDSMSRSYREENLIVLQAYHTKIRKLISEMNETVKQNEKLLRSNKLLKVSKYKSKLKEYTNFPENIDLYMPSFGSKTNQGKELAIEIGNVKAILKQLPQTTLPVDVSSLKKTTGELQDKARVIATIPTDYKTLFGVACVGDGEAWIRGNNRTVARIDIHGTVKDIAITTCQYWPGGIALTRDEELIFSDRNSNIVNTVRHWKCETLITTPQDWLPCGLCCTQSGDILVNMFALTGRHKIIRYHGQTKKQEIYNDVQGNPIFKDGFGNLYMWENNNGDICVSDTNADTVIVVDKTIRVRFRYTGIPALGMKPFAPRGIVTDALSHIVVADLNNHCLNILDENGRFLRCVDDCGLEKPYGLSVDSWGRLWVGCESGKITVIEYLKIE